MSSQNTPSNPLDVVPDNLPMDLGENTPMLADGGVAESDGVDLLRLTVSDIAKLRQALIASLGHDHQWTDDEIRTMALNTLNATQVFLRIAEAQCRRGVLSWSETNSPVWKDEGEGGRNP